MLVRVMIVVAMVGLPARWCNSLRINRRLSRWIYRSSTPPSGARAAGLLILMTAGSVRLRSPSKPGRHSNIGRAPQ